LELHNVVICTSPIQTFMIDFESSESSFVGPEKSWNDLRLRDYYELLRLAVYLQCGLGRQKGALAQKSLENLSLLFDTSSTFAARLDVADRTAAAVSSLH
jgi:hypothetical protein